ncbi:MAG: hypothetical protein EOM76_08455 [Sphingobacteriia bacterium]|nr:hypothetical protein [Sphingobacteriia bacterium]
MKKSLLMVAAFAFVFSTYAQRNTQAIKNDNAFAKKHYLKIDQNESLGPVNHSKSVVSTAFHSSLNGYTLLSGKKITADQTSKKSPYIARAGGSFGFTGSDISHKMTTDGVAFDSVTFVNADARRYPGGTFFRDGSDLYVVSSGPITGGSGWTSNFLFSAKIDGTNAAQISIQKITSTLQLDFVTISKDIASMSMNHYDYPLLKGAYICVFRLRKGGLNAV